MKVFWSRCGHGYGNFGDKLTPLLLDRFGIRYRWSSPEQADLIGVGSLIEKIPEGFKGVVWSTGNMFDETRKTFSHAEVLAVRGRLTLDRLSCRSRSNVALGDGGLLCDLFFERGAKKYQLGIIPHFADQQNGIISQVAANNPGTTIIDVCAPTLEVISRVGECEAILSSSLHGLILADSLGVPNHWIDMGQGTVAGHGFKYRDYYSIFDLDDVQPLRLRGSETLPELKPVFARYTRPGIAGRKEKLRISLEALVRRFGADSAKTVPLNELRIQERHRAIEREEWNRQVQSFIELLKMVLPIKANFILVDDEQLRSEMTQASAIPFLERDGEYFGLPENDEHAINELQRLSRQGIRYIVFAWPSFWWLEAYPGLRSHLAFHAETVFESEIMKAFRLIE